MKQLVLEKSITRAIEVQEDVQELRGTPAYAGVARAS